MNANLKRYEIFGWDYEHFNPLTEKKIAWYLKYAHKSKGPILELACGTGRLLIALAEAGFECDGIDLSTGMLKIAARQMAQLPPQMQSRIRIHNMDMTDFQLARKYNLIIIGDNSIGELETREEQLSCLKCSYQHLRPDGMFLLTVRRFNPASFVDGRKETPWSEQICHPITGHMVSRKVRMQLAPDGKSVHGVMRYKTTATNGREIIEEFYYDKPVMSPDDYISLLTVAGFSPTIFVDYEDRKDDGKGLIFCIVCDKLS
jgi:SAM-dependent methyltransferase